MATWSQVLQAREKGFADEVILDRLATLQGKQDEVSQQRARGASVEAILEKLAPKLGGVEAAALGAADGLTFNLTDEIAGKAVELVNSPTSSPMDRLVSQRSPYLSGRRMGVSEAELAAGPSQASIDAFNSALTAAQARGAEATEAVRGLQDRARTEEGGLYTTGVLGGAVASFPLGGAAAKGAQAAARVTGAQAAGSALVKAGAETTKAAGRLVPRAVKTAASNVASAIPKVVKTGAADVVKTLGRGAGAGFAYGAAAGAGDARGGLNERISGGMSGGTMGMMFGAPGALVLRYGIGGAAAFWKEKFGRTFAEKATAMMVRRAREDGVDVDDLIKSFYTNGDEAARMRSKSTLPSPERTAGEYLGQGAKDLQIALANRPGPGKEIAARTLMTRGQEAGKRVNQQFSDALKAEGDDFYDEAARLRDKRLTEPEGHYQAAYAAKVEDEEFYHIVQLFRQRKRFREVLPKAAQYAEDFGRGKVVREIKRFARALDDDLAASAGKSTRATGKAGGAAGDMSEATWNKLPRLSVEALDYVERMLSDGIDYLAGKSPAQAAGVTQARDALRKLLPKELNDARSKSAAGFDTERALQEGRQAFQQGVDLEEMAARLRESTPEATEAYIKGIARGVYDLFNRQTNMGGLADATRRVQGNDLARQKLLELLPKTPAGKPTARAKELLRRLDEEAEMASHAKAALGNSQTAPRQAAIEAAEEGDTLDNIAALIAERLTGQGGSASERAGRWAVDKLKQPGIRNRSINQELAQRLFAKGHPEVLGVLREMRDYGRKVSSDVIPKTPERVGVRTGARLQGQAAAAADPFANDYDGAQASVVVESMVAPALMAIIDPATSEDARLAAQAEIEATLDTPARWQRYVALLERYDLEPLTRGPTARTRPAQRERQAEPMVPAQ